MSSTADLILVQEEEKVFIPVHSNYLRQVGDFFDNLIAHKSFRESTYSNFEELEQDDDSDMSSGTWKGRTFRVV